MPLSPFPHAACPRVSDRDSLFQCLAASDDTLPREKRGGGGEGGKEGSAHKRLTRARHNGIRSPDGGGSALYTWPTGRLWESPHRHARYPSICHTHGGRAEVDECLHPGLALPDRTGTSPCLEEVGRGEGGGEAEGVSEKSIFLSATRRKSISPLRGVKKGGFP